MRAKEFLRQQGVPYVEHDVSVDQRAAQEMVQRSGQMGVPVIIAGDEVIVGFDRPRLAALVGRYGPAASTERPRIGLIAKDQPGGGVVVGSARPDSPAAAAGFQPGDVIERWQGQPVASLAALEELIAQQRPGAVVDVQVRRGATVVQLRLPA